MPEKVRVLGEDKPLFEIRAREKYLFIAVTLFYWMSLYIYVPVFSPYLETQGISYLLIGFLISSYGLVQLVVRLPLGILSDRKRVRRPFIIFGMLAAALSCFLFTIPGSWGWTLAARMMAGVSASCWVAFTVLYAGYFGKREIPRAMGSISLINTLGQLGGMTLSGWMSDRWGYNALFWTGAGIGLIGMAAAFAIKEPGDGVAREPIRISELAGVLSSRLLLKASLLSILAQGVLFITMFGFTSSRAVEIGASKSQLSLLVLAFMIPNALSSYASGRWMAPRLGVWTTLAVGFAVSAAGTLAISLAPAFGWLVLTQTVNGFAQGMVGPLLLSLAIRDFGPSKQATAMGFYQAVYSVGMAGGPFLAGWLNDIGGLSSGFYLGSGFAAAGAVVTLLWKTQPLLQK